MSTKKKSIITSSAILAVITLVLVIAKVAGATALASVPLWQCFLPLMIPAAISIVLAGGALGVIALYLAAVLLVGLFILALDTFGGRR